MNSGAKAWRLYGAPVEIPYRGEEFELTRHEPGEVTETFTLSAGDCVYIPRGLMHDAENVGDEPSLHITVDFEAPMKTDIHPQYATATVRCGREALVACFPKAQRELDLERSGSASCNGASECRVGLREGERRAELEVEPSGGQILTGAR